MGYVYCFANDSMPGLLKIGMTERTPEERLHEANQTDTWKPPTPYYYIFAKRVDNPKQKEKTLHRILQEERVNPNREFFCVSIEKVSLLFELIDGEFYGKQKVKDVVEEFCNNFIEIKEGELKEVELYLKFCEWTNLLYGKRWCCIQKGKELFDYIDKRYSVRKGTKWYGIMIKSDGEVFDLI